ncbi:MAG: gamma-glutamyltransferase family protein [Oscillospiraceae bacterium]|jgi:gamma-glutamyltranspeptidase/glutathione hydrolase|nr:gamma-glutamyltransferase family protein [Oscillospiraceae bacterium]
MNIPELLGFDPTFVPHPSTRYPVYASRGMAASTSPQASAAGLDILRAGGNAVDAAIAMAATLTVTEPNANGIGSDAFALIWIEKEQRLYGLNGSGWSPRAFTLEAAQARAEAGRMPAYGWLPTMVPGAPKAWAAMQARFGRNTLLQNLAPAIAYAEEGYPCAPILSRSWSGAAAHYRRVLTDAAFEEWFRTFLFNGEAPKPGQIVRLPNHARSLRTIGESNAEAFYQGELAKAIVADSRANGGLFAPEDFSEYDVTWVEPLRVNYRGWEVCEIPPNGQGIAALMALNILNTFDSAAVAAHSAEAYHLQWEAMKIAFADAFAHVTDPAQMRVSPQDLLAPAFGRLRAEAIGARAQVHAHAQPPRGGTVYFCAADREGNRVSMIQSNYMGFGSGIVVRGTGISLQNRGADFSLDPAHVNCAAPRKKTYHTIIPGFLMRDGKAVGSFGVMGGYMQPQGHVQVVTNLIDRQMNPQQALDAPRWQWLRDGRFVVERGFDGQIVQQLERMGHRVGIEGHEGSFGRGQIIIKGEDGALIGGTERRDSGTIASS